MTLFCYIGASIGIMGGLCGICSMCYAYKLHNYIKNICKNLYFRFGDAK